MRIANQRLNAISQGRVLLSFSHLPHVAHVSQGAGVHRPVAGTREAVAAKRLQRAWRGSDQAAVAAEDAALRARNAAAATAGRPLEYVYRSLYLPEQGMFCQLPTDLQLGIRLPVRTPMSCLHVNNDRPNVELCRSASCPQTSRWYPPANHRSCLHLFPRVFRAVACAQAVGCIYPQECVKEYEHCTVCTDMHAGRTCCVPPTLLGGRAQGDPLCKWRQRRLATAARRWRMRLRLLQAGT